MRKAILHFVATAAIAGAVYAADPPLIYEGNIDLQALPMDLGGNAQWDIGAKVGNTSRVRFYTFSGTNILDPSAYTVTFHSGKSRDEAGQIQVSSFTTTTTYVEFKFSTNNLAYPFRKWYSSVKFVSGNNIVSQPEGNFSVSGAPEVDGGSVSFTYNRNWALWQFSNGLTNSPTIGDSATLNATTNSKGQVILSVSNSAIGVSNITLTASNAWGVSLTGLTVSDIQYPTNLSAFTATANLDMNGHSITNIATNSVFMGPVKLSTGAGKLRVNDTNLATEAYADSVGSTATNDANLMRFNVAGTIAVDMINTASPWAENEIVSTMATDAELATVAVAGTNYSDAHASLTAVNAHTASNLFLYWNNTVITNGWQQAFGRNNLTNLQGWADAISEEFAGEVVRSDTSDSNISANRTSDLASNALLAVDIATNVLRIVEATNDSNLARLNVAGTIAANWVNTANPWADNEVVDTITASSYLPLAGGTLSGLLDMGGQVESNVTSIFMTPSDSALIWPMGTNTRLHIAGGGTGVGVSEFSGGRIQLFAANHATASAGSVKLIPSAGGYIRLDGPIDAGGNSITNIATNSVFMGPVKLSTGAGKLRVNDTNLATEAYADSVGSTATNDANLMRFNVAGTIAVDMINTASPWADNEVADNLTVDDAGIASTITRDSELAAAAVAATNHANTKLALHETRLKMVTNIASPSAATPITTDQWGWTFKSETGSNHNYTLPSVSASDIGAYYYFAKVQQETVTVVSADSDIIANSTNVPGSILNGTTGENWGASLMLRLVESNRWVIQGLDGTWTIDY